MRYELVDGGSAKFWQVRVEGKALRIAWGRIGTAGQAQSKEFKRPHEAKAAHDKLVNEKLKKGYRPVARGAKKTLAKTSVVRNPASTKIASATFPAEISLREIGITYPSGVSFDPRGERLVTRGKADVRVWTRGEAKPRKVAPKGFTGLVPLKDGIAALCGTKIEVYDAATLALRATWALPRGTKGSRIDASPTGDLVGVTFHNSRRDDETLILDDRGRTIGRVEGPGDLLADGAFVRRDGAKVRVWPRGAARPNVRSVDAFDRLGSMVHGPEGHMATTTQDGQAAFLFGPGWHTKPPKIVAKLEAIKVGARRGFTAVSLDFAGRRLFAAARGRVWQVDASGATREWAVNAEEIFSLAATMDVVACVCEKGIFVLTLDGEAHKPNASPSKPAKKVADSKSVAAALRRLVAASDDPNARVADGAARSALDDLSRALGHAVPKQLAELLAKSDGGARFGDWTLLSTREIAKSHATWSKIASDLDPEDEDEEDPT